MLKSTSHNNKKNTTQQQQQQQHKKSPLTTQKRTKTWKRRQERKAEGLPKGLRTTQPGHLTQVLHDRKLVREHLTSYSQITPRSEWITIPTKANNWMIEAVDPPPKELHQRILSYCDQFETPLRPKQIVNHFVNHPTAPIKKTHVYDMMKKLTTLNNLRTYTKWDEEGTQHWYIGTTTKSRINHNEALQNLIKGKRALPLEEVVWETIEERADSFANIRTLNHQQVGELIIQRKKEEEQHKADLIAKRHTV